MRRRALRCDDVSPWILPQSATQAMYECAKLHDMWHRRQRLQILHDQANLFRRRVYRQKMRRQCLPARGICKPRSLLPKRQHPLRIELPKLQYIYEPCRRRRMQCRRLLPSHGMRKRITPIQQRLRIRRYRSLRSAWQQMRNTKRDELLQRCHLLVHMQSKLSHIHGSMRNRQP